MIRGRIYYIPDSFGNPRWTVHWRVNVDGVQTVRAQTFTDRDYAEAFVSQLTREAVKNRKERNRSIIRPCELKNDEQEK